MKQHITVEQLNELRSDAKKKLGLWYSANDRACEGDWYVEYGEEHYYGQFDGRGGEPSTYMPISSDVLPLLSIGQMIEFLMERNNEISMGFDDSGCFWRIYAGGRGSGSMMKDMGKEYTDYDIYELCDALWEAVKEVLESKHE